MLIFLVLIMIQKERNTDSPVFGQEIGNILLII